MIGYYMGKNKTKAHLDVDSGARIDNSVVLYLNKSQREAGMNRLMLKLQYMKK